MYAKQKSKYTEKDSKATHANKRGDRKSNQLPEFELRKPSDEGLELIRTLGGQQRRIRRLKLRINQRGQEPNQQIQDVDPKGISDDVKPLNIVHPYEIKHCYNKCSDPPRN